MYRWYYYYLLESFLKHYFFPNRTSNYLTYCIMGLWMDMQLYMKYNVNIFSECLVKGAILAFSALFLSFYFDAPKEKSWNRTKS